MLPNSSRLIFLLTLGRLLIPRYCLYLRSIAWPLVCWTDHLSNRLNWAVATKSENEKGNTEEPGSNYLPDKSLPEGTASEAAGARPLLEHGLRLAQGRGNSECVA